ncbi:MAG: nucleotidyltransferase domain-containing protein [Gemmatimonadota bacterium]
MESGALRPSRNLIEAIEEALSVQPEIAAAYLYGSAARGRTTALSDVDVAVLFRATTHGPEDRRAVLGELLGRIGRRFPGEEFDVRDAEALPLAVVGRVLTEGIRVLDADPSRRVAFEVRTRMRFFDFLPFQAHDTRHGLRALREKLGG